MTELIEQMYTEGYFLYPTSELKDYEVQAQEIIDFVIDNDNSQQNDNLDEIKELADNYAHCYSFVGDDTMPIAQKKLYDAIDALKK